MVRRRAIASILPLLFAGFGAWAQTEGIITGRVTDFDTRESIFGARIADVTDEANEIPGSFVGDGVYFILNVPEGFRDNIKVSAPGYFDKSGQVTVEQGAPGVLDFELIFDTSLNTAEITLPIGKSAEPPFLLPPIVEAVQDGIVVGRTFVRSGNQYRIGRIPDGRTTFRSASAFYVVGTETFDLFSEEQPIEITLPVSVPGTRGPITGSVGGVVRDSREATIAAHVFATFLFEGSPVIVTNDSGGDGLYQIDLLHTVTTEVKAHDISSTERTPLPPASLVITAGFVATQDLTVAPFNPVTANFIPIVASHPAVVIYEDDPRVLIIGDFSVTDSDHAFSAFHTLVIYPGFNYTHSNILPGSTQITPDLDWNGSLAVPVSMSDPLDTSAPFILMVTVNAVPDPTVYVDFDTGLPAGGGGTGGAANPFLAVGEALSEFTAGGPLPMKRSAPSPRPPLTTQPTVPLQTNPPAGPVRADPPTR